MSKFITICLFFGLATLAYSGPIPGSEAVLTPLVLVESEAVPVSGPEAVIRDARHLKHRKHHHGYGGGYNNGYGNGGYYPRPNYGGGGSYATASAGSFNQGFGGGSQSNAQAASFNVGPFSGSFASSFSNSQGGGGWY